MNLKNSTYIAIGILLLGGVGWWFFSSSSQNSQTTTQNNTLGTSDTRTTVTTSGSTSTDTNQVVSTAQTSSQQKIFKVADGPITGATFIQTTHPTTTIVRYVLANNGHVLDQPLDMPGSIARAVSNTTIPGSMRALWASGGGALILQYLDSGTIKTVGLGFPLAVTATSTAQAVRIQFFPDGIANIAVSPDGKQSAYLLSTNKGVDGYIAKIDGTGSKKLFSIPLSQVLLSWPSMNTLLVQSKSTAGVPGILFSINAKTGDTVPLLYAEGLTATADTTFAHIVYQTVTGDPLVNTSYSHDTKKGTDAVLSFNPIPEKCISGTLSGSMYCAMPLQYTSPDYLDSWHMGTASVADAIFSLNLLTELTSIIASPGGGEGGEDSDIAQMSVSPDGNYLLFIKKGDGSLWAVRLTQ